MLMDLIVLLQALIGCQGVVRICSLYMYLVLEYIVTTYKYTQYAMHEKSKEE